MKKSSRVISIYVALALAAWSAESVAAGLAIGTQSGSGTGNAYAGGAAAGEDASTVWYNPAAMTLLPKGPQLAISAEAIKPSFKFANTASTGIFAAPGTGDGGDGGDWALLPQSYATTSIGDKWWLGGGINVPFGLKTDYDAGWRGKATALRAELKTFNFNVGVGYKLNDVVSLGGGVSYQKLQLKFSGQPPGPSGVVEISGSDHATGFNLGALFQLTPATRVGVAYRSSMSFHPQGTATFSALAPNNSGSIATVAEPETISISAFSALTPQWDLMADATWTRWSRIQALTFVRTTGALAGPAGTVITSLPFAWSDSWRLSIGANYKINDSWKLRMGAAYDQSPTNDTTRTPRIPDQDRTWLAIGVQYRVSAAGKIDFGYAHEFIKDATINVAAPAPAPGRLVGTSENQADIISIQYTHSF